MRAWQNIPPLTITIERKRKKMSNYEYGPNDTDDGYDALKDNYLTGTGPAYNDKTRQAERDEEENYRQSRYYY